MPREGPTTPEGLAISSRNAARHGLFSAAVVVGDETLAAWQAFFEGIINSLEPEGDAETEMAARAASIMWRLRRVPVAEANLTGRDAAREALYAERRARYRKDGQDYEQPDAYYASALPAPAPEEPPPLPVPEVGHLVAIARYEAHLGRQLLHSLHELEALQARRRGDRIPLARVDVHGLPGT